jgi:hypothetical protein
MQSSKISVLRTVFHLRALYSIQPSTNCEAGEGGRDRIRQEVAVGKKQLDLGLSVENLGQVQGRVGGPRGKAEMKMDDKTPR